MSSCRFTTLTLVAMLLFSVQVPSDAAAPSTSRVLTTDRRIVVTNDPPFVLGFGSELHTPGDPCVLFPPELNLQDLTFEQNSDGYVANAIFFNPISSLTELNGKPVTLVVNLVLAPPDTSRITVRASLTSGKVTVKQGKEDLDPGSTPVKVVLNIDRLVFALPESIGIAPDWDVWAEVSLSAKNAWCDPPYPVNSYSRTTPPATVGSLIGGDPTGTITAPSTPYDGYLPVKAKVMPKGSKLESVSFERDADGRLIAIATMDGNVLDLATSAKDSYDALHVDIDLADPSFFGLIYPYTLSWTYFPNGNPEPVAQVEDPYLGAAFILGTVPVTVDGDRVLFHLGQFTEIDYPAIESAALPILVGDFTSLFFGISPGSDPVCVCPADEDPDLVVDDPFLEYQIIGNLISIKHLATGETAYGWIDHAGRFLAQNENELYRGAIGFFPNGETYDVGVQVIYVRILDVLPDSLSSIGARSPGISFRTSIPSISLLSMTNNTALEPIENRILDYVRRTLKNVTETDIYDCEHPPESFTSTDTSDLTSMSNVRKFQFIDDCDSYSNALLLGRLLLESARSDPALFAAYQQALSQTVGMSNPAAPLLDDSTVMGFSSPATPIALPSEPFPLPYTIATPFQPQSTNGDWAIRASSEWNYTLDSGETGSGSVTTPFIDSHLVIADLQLGSTKTQPLAIAAIGNAILSEPARQRRKTGRVRRLRQRTLH